MKPTYRLCLALILLLTAGGCEPEWARSSEPAEVGAITNVSVPETCVQGGIVPVVVTVKNRGDQRQTFEIILTDRTEGREISRKSVTLSPAGTDGMDDVVDLVFSGENTGDMFGSWLDAGDVNGDGYDDILVSTPMYDRGRGKAYLYHGGKTMNSKVEIAFTGENLGDRFSSGSAHLADMNNDGFDDVIAGARFHNDIGRVYLFWGGPDMDEKADIIFEAAAEEEEVKGSSFGRGVAIGDLNGDGHKDLIVSAPGFDNSRGCAYLYFGPVASDTMVDKIFLGEGAHDLFSFPRTACGDVDGDGCDDLLIGTRNYPNEANRGRAYFYYGAPGTAMDTVCDFIFDAENDKGQFGAGVDLFDVDNDRHADVIISARAYSGGQGRTYIYWGNSREAMDNVADVTLTGEPDAGSAFGGDHVMAGHINDDEYGDIIVTAWGYYQWSYHSRVYLFYGGSKSTTDNIFDRAFTGDKPGSWIMDGRIADFNGDGRKDIAVGGWGYPNSTNQGRVWLYYGTHPSSTGVKFSWDTKDASVGYHDLRVKVDPVAGGQDTPNNTKSMLVKVASATRDLEEQHSQEKLQKSPAKSKEPVKTALSFATKPNQSFTRAAVNGSVEQIRSYLARGTDINERTISGDTALHYAIKYRHAKVAKLLIAEGADVKYQNRDGETPAHLAIKADQRDILDLLIAKGATVSPAHLAAYKGDKDRVKRFIEGRISVNAADEGGLTLLHAAASGGQKNVAEYLIGQGAEVNACDKKRQTPLFCAAAAGHKDMVELLIARGSGLNAQRDPDRWTPLCVAVHANHKDIVELLADNGANVNSEDITGHTALHYAARRGHKDIAQLLVEKGMVISDIYEAAYVGDSEKVKTYIREGTDVNSMDLYRSTALHFVARGSQLEVAELLIANGANVSAGDNWTPLQEAANHSMEMVELLLAHGANINEGGWSPLHSALDAERFDIVELLLAKGADVNIKDDKGRTPLHIAAWYAAHDNPKIVELLLSKGADINAKDDSGETALAYAVEGGYSELAEILRKHGAKE